MFKTPYGQTPIFAQRSRRRFSFVSAHLSSPLARGQTTHLLWHSFHPTLFFWRKQNIFASQNSNFTFFTSKLRRWQFFDAFFFFAASALPLGSACGLVNRKAPPTWNSFKPKWTEIQQKKQRNKETKRSSLQKWSKNATKYLRPFSFFQTSLQLPAFLFAAALAALFGRAFALDSADSHCLHVEVREKVGCKSL